MTVNATPSVNNYVGNGVATVYAFGFKILDALDLKVMVNGIVVTNYTVSGVRDPPGGSITFSAAPINGALVRIARNMAIARSTDWQVNGPLPADTLNDDQDAPVMMIQQVDEKVGRALKLAETDPTVLVDLPNVANRANKLLAFDSNGQPQAISSVLGTATQLALDLLSSIGSSLVGFIQSGTGAVARSAQSKMREWLSWEDFGIVADGVTNDLPALQNLINESIARGIRRIVLPGGRAIGLAGKLTINTPGLEIIGSLPLTLHDVGTNAGRAYFTATGGYTGTLIEIFPVEGAANRAIDGIVFKASIICNGAGIGLDVKSIKNSHLDVHVENAVTIGMRIGVATTLGEARDSQYNKIRFVGRQIEQNGIALYLDGDPTANTSINVFENVAIQHKDNVAIYLNNADNNVWLNASCFRVGGGTSANSTYCNGSNTSGVNCRNEIFVRYSANTPMIAKGIGLSNPAKNIHILSFDKDNGSPDPAIETGASVQWHNSDETYPMVLASDNSGAVLGAGPTMLGFYTEVRDLDNSWNGNTFTAKRTGPHRFTINLTHTAGVTAGDRWIIALFVGATSINYTYKVPAADFNSVSFTCDQFVTAGDACSWSLYRAGGAGNFPLFNNVNANNASISFFGTK